VGGWSTPRSGRFTLGKTRYSLYMRLGGTQGRSGQVRKISPPPGFDPRTFQPVASPYTDWDISALYIKIYIYMYNIYYNVTSCLQWYTNSHPQIFLYFCLFLSLLFHLPPSPLQGWYLNRNLNILNAVTFWLLRISVAFWKIWKYFVFLQSKNSFFF